MAGKNDNMAQISVRLDPGIRKRLKILASLRGMSMNELITNLLEQAAEPQHIEREFKRVVK